MSRGKYLSLEEARNQGKLARFAKEQQSKGSEKQFDNMLGRMAHNKPVKEDKK